MTTPRRRAAPLFERCDHETAEGLLDALADHWRGNLSRRYDKWAFRGQRDATWGLTPSAFRAGAFDRYFNGTLMITDADDAGRRAVEEGYVLDFATFADEQGHAVPGDSPILRDLGMKRDTTGAVFPPADVRWFFALAQHYGVPTRLLDWSWNPLVATYFACQPIARAVVERSPHPDRFAVWMFSTSFAREVSMSWPIGVHLVTAPRASNPNLRAQAGLFTLVARSVPITEDAGPLPDLDELFREPPDQVTGEERRDLVPALFQHTLPAREARSLLRMLAGQQVSASTIYAGHEGAALRLHEQRWHQHAPVGRRS